MADSKETKERRLAIERLLDEARAQGTTLTHRQLADHLGVSTKSIQRDLEAIGNKPKPMSREVFEVVHDENLSTIQMITSAIRRTNEQLDELHKEMGFTGDACPECGRKALDFNALLWTANFKGGDTLDKQIQTRAKVLGELIESHVVTVQHRDEDVTLMLQGIASIREVELRDLVQEKSFVLPDGAVNVEAVTEALMRRILGTFRDQSARRAARLPSPVQILDMARED